MYRLIKIAPTMIYDTGIPQSLPSFLEASHGSWSPTGSSQLAAQRAKKRKSVHSPSSNLPFLAQQPDRDRGIETSIGPTPMLPMPYNGSPPSN